MEDARTVVHRWIDAFNAHDEQALRAATAEDATITAPPELTLEGRDAVVGYAMAWANAFPDATIAVHHETVEADTAVIEFTFSGNHQATLSGPDGDIPATHKHLDGRGVQVNVVADGVVRRVRLYFDQVQVMTQLGLMPTPAGAS